MVSIDGPQDDAQVVGHWALDYAADIAVRREAAERVISSRRLLEEIKRTTSIEDLAGRLGIPLQVVRDHLDTLDYWGWWEIDARITVTEEMLAS